MENHENLTDHDLLVRIDERVSALHLVVNGNGKGLVSRTENMERWRSFMQGAVMVLYAIVTLSIAAAAVLGKK